METKIVISKNWELLVCYPFFITLNKGDTVCFDDIEYRVKDNILDINHGRITIRVEE